MRTPARSSACVLGGPIRKFPLGQCPIDAFVQAVAPLGIKARVLDYQEHALTSGGDAQAAAYVEVAVGDLTYWGVGIDANIVSASIKAVTSAINRAR